ncbi:tape measure protein [Shewanella oneidensis]|uniref:Mu phage tape measure protein Gp42 n=1 Tax=Shewanella oneidensis (strain ATCC 700550 / JCM 31522 / CIP 106686 / LMG 19005 / NCIMB 14063 / MR-1) TaxID=211586 RepID=Q8EDP6_SHEON|nr:tape measure protein [Shewanella oneidensis]AAN55725.1 Mu phage tape measure protein Gp42 [Shewanella oneidensis MR-1]MDX5995634.1 tape measure protein [Shewanella oneidensis]MEE2026315.1 hypothetical protein [Shewanella oneidensis]
MSKKLVTDIVLNLSGNLSEKAIRYGDQIKNLGEKSKVGFGMISSSAAAASRGIDTFGNRAILGVSAGAIAFERTFIKTAAEFERYQIMLNKLQGSEANGLKAMEWIEKFTQETPYGVNEVMNSFIRLKAFGLDPMDGSLQAIADQAAMMGGTAETVDGIALALGQAWTKGKLQGEEALQLLERGVPVWDYLIKASKDLGKNNGVGYTAAQLQDMASKGLLTRDAIKSLIKEMGSASQGSSKKQMESWNGMISNMGDAWTIFKKDVMSSGAFTVLKTELGGVLKQLDEMKKTGEYDKLVEKVGKDLVEGFKTAAEAARGLRDVGRDLLPILKAIGSGASAIADAVGGYENLAKILLSVYMLNKALRIGAPLLKGAIGAGGFVFDKATGGLGGKGKGGISDLGVMPVYVVNMGAGGMGGGLPDGVDPTGTKKGASKASRIFNLQNLAALGTVGYAANMTYQNPDDWLPFNLRRKSELDPTALHGIPAAPGLLDVLDDFKRWFAGSPSPDAANVVNAMNTVGSKLALDISVSDDRIKVKPKSIPPGIVIDADTGTN